MFSFKSSLNLTVEKAHEIERATRGQHKTAVWFSVRKYRITASNFGAVLSQKDATPPDKLVMQIIQPRSFSTPATRHGIENEKHAISQGVPVAKICDTRLVFYIRSLPTHPLRHIASCNDIHMK